MGPYKPYETHNEPIGAIYIPFQIKSLNLSIVCQHRKFETIISTDVRNIKICASQCVNSQVFATHSLLTLEKMQISAKMHIMYLRANV